LAQIAIIARSGDDLTPLPSELLRVPMPPVATSSTMVRKALANGVNIQDWIAATVMTYLRDHNLYAKASCHA
jgi:nicotinic acid mononucleotide adenylyltransferase